MFAVTAKIGEDRHEATQRLADADPADRRRADHHLAEAALMKNAMLVLFGFGLILLLPGKTAIIAVGGLDAGLLSVLAEAKWPKARETYVDPTRRPKPSTPAASYVAAALIALGSAAFATFAWKMALPRFPLVAAFGFYMAAAGVGMSVGIVLTARRSSEAHNAWLASMTPRAPLDF